MTAPDDAVRLEAGAADAGRRLDAWIAERVPAWSRTYVQELIRDGCLTGNGCTEWRPRDRVVPGMRYCLCPPPPRSATVSGQAMALDILYEDHDVIVINKPPGLVVHPAPGHPDGTLVNALLYHCRDLKGVGGERRPGIVHRLDKDTSGVMVAAKHQQSMDALAAQFHDRRVQKAYLAIVAPVPCPASGRIETAIARSPHDRKRMCATDRGGRMAVSLYHVERVLGSFAVVRVRIETGRTHQIRVQMAHIGSPVAGDRVYGRSARRLWEAMGGCPRQMLHAEHLSFAHPADGRPLTFTAPCPPDMAAFLDRLASAGVLSKVL